MNETDEKNEIANLQSQIRHLKKMAALGELTAAVSHEIKNPLSFIRNFSELSEEIVATLQKENSPNEKIAEEQLENLRFNLNKITRNSQRMADTLERMLLYSRPAPKNYHPTNVQKILDEFIYLVYSTARARMPKFNVKSKKKYEKDAIIVDIIPGDISRVFMNLLDNACASMQKKVESVENYEPRMIYEIKKDGDNTTIRFRDNGLGIPAKNRKLIFEPFFTTKNAPNSSGLGLSICNEIIKDHGGSITVKSRKGQFADFIISLPTRQTLK